MLREKPENLGAHITKQIDLVKRVIAPFYMDHIDIDGELILRQSREWSDNVMHAYKNLLLGNDMQKFKSELTGFTTYTFPEPDVRTVQTSVKYIYKIIDLPNLDKLRQSKYAYFENALRDLNITSCELLASCHKKRFKVCSTLLLGKTYSIKIVAVI